MNWTICSKSNPAWLTIGAFGLMLVVLAAAHPFAGEAKPIVNETGRTAIPFGNLLARRASEGPAANADGREAMGRVERTVLSDWWLAPRSRVGLTGGSHRVATPLPGSVVRPSLARRANLSEVSP